MIIHRATPWVACSATTKFRHASVGRSGLRVLSESRSCRTCITTSILDASPGLPKGPRPSSWPATLSKVWRALSPTFALRPQYDAHRHRPWQQRVPWASADRGKATRQGTGTPIRHHASGKQCCLPRGSSLRGRHHVDGLRARRLRDAARHHACRHGPDGGSPPHHPLHRSMRAPLHAEACARAVPHFDRLHSWSADRGLRDAHRRGHSPSSVDPELERKAESRPPRGSLRESTPTSTDAHFRCVHSSALSNRSRDW